MQFKVGNGARIRFWEDMWTRDSSLAYRFPLLYRKADSHNACISSIRHDESFLSGFSWNLKLCRNFRERELVLILELISLLDTVTFCTLVANRRV